MYTITSLIAITDAGRQSSNIVTHIDGADAITGLLRVHVAIFQLPSRQCRRLQRSRTIGLRLPQSSSAKIIPEDKASFTSNDGWETRCVSRGGGKGPGTLLLVLPLTRAPGLDCECGWPRAQNFAFLLWYFTEHGSAIEAGEEEDEEREGGEGRVRTVRNPNSVQV